MSKPMQVGTKSEVLFAIMSHRGDSSVAREVCKKKKKGEKGSDVITELWLNFLDILKNLSLLRQTFFREI